MRNALYGFTIHVVVVLGLVQCIAYNKNAENLKLNQELRATLHERQKTACGNIMIDHALDRLFSRAFGNLDMSDRHLKVSPATPSSTRIGLYARHEALRASEEIDVHKDRCLEWVKRKRELSRSDREMDREAFPPR